VPEKAFGDSECWGAFRLMMDEQVNDSLSGKKMSIVKEHDA